MSAISCVACCVRLAKVRTSSATTAKPRPCSPARAASMAALSASRLVCSEIPRIVSTTEPITAAFCSTPETESALVDKLSNRVFMELIASRICSTPDAANRSVLRVASDDSLALRATSRMVVAISSIDAATESRRWRSSRTAIST